MSGTPLEIRNLSAGYRRRPVLTGVTLEPFYPGELTALVGPNAAGKTTLLRAVAGLHPARGEILYDGRDLLQASPTEHAATVTYMPQALPQQISLTVFESVLSALNAVPTGCPRSSREAARESEAVLARLGIEHLAMAALDELSGGQRQLASLAQAIVRAPRILLLDEPTSALDMRHAFSVMRLVKDLAAERGMIVLVVLHDIALASRWAERIVLLGNGRVAASGPAEAAVTPETLADVYGVKARVERCSRGLVQISVDDVLPARDADARPDATGTS
ncbi:ABC transporter ATP-binding protein [Amorphus sp. 3PC139-8]|uniref:ABC transporter ATP-binding protein n=1 Tax=Amorphus sp. 3PC139-8 TaxID=2735676 RepID=UPI00345CB21A